MPAPENSLEWALLRMRRAAVVNAFEELGLHYVPRNIWVFTDISDDIADGLERFFKAVGIEADQIREQNIGYVAKTNELLRLFVDVGDAFDHLSTEAQERLRRRLYSGDYEAVRVAANAASQIAKLSRAAARWPEDRQFSAFKAFLQEVQVVLNDPLVLNIDELSSVVGSIDPILSAMVNFDHARIEYEFLLTQIGGIWPSQWTMGAEADALAADTSVFEALVALLLDDPDRSLDESIEAIAELYAINLRLTELYNQAQHLSSGKRGSAGGGARGGRAPPPPRSARDEAMAFYGFAPGTTPTDEQIKRAHRAYLKANHPDLAGDDDVEIARRNEACKAANWHRDNLLRGSV